MPASSVGGILSGLGNFGLKILTSLQELKGTIADALGLGRQAGIVPSLEVVEKEWGHVQVSGENAEQISHLRDFEVIPDELYSPTDIPLKRPFAYQVSVYGRDLSTGRFTHQEWNLPVSREMTIEEIKDTARQRLGSAGTSPLVDIFDVKVTNAWIREGEE